MVLCCAPGTGGDLVIARQIKQACAATYQFLLVGPSSAGKTTFLYRLKFGEYWASEEIIKDMEDMQDDKNFHYEVLRNDVGVWDVPGMIPATWTIFYRHLEYDSVLYLLSYENIFVESPSMEDMKSVADAADTLRTMHYEMELRDAPFIVLLNKKKSTVIEDEHQQILLAKEMLDFDRLDPSRTKMYIINASEFQQEHAIWQEIVKFVRQYRQNVLA